MTDLERPTFAPDSGSDVDPFKALAPAHRLGLASTAQARLRTVDQFNRLSAPPRRFVALPWDAAASFERRDYGLAQPQAWSVLPHGWLRIAPLAGALGSPWQQVASILLWPHLSPDVEWLDLIVAARIGDKQVVLPARLDDEAENGEAFQRSVLVLDEQAHSPVSAAELRRALQRPDATIAVVVMAELGAFAVLEIDLSPAEASA